jgi:hypothetical protein
MTAGYKIFAVDVAFAEQYDQVQKRGADRGVILAIVPVFTEQTTACL